VDRQPAEGDKLSPHFETPETMHFETAPRQSTTSGRRAARMSGRCARVLRNTHPLSRSSEAGKEEQMARNTGRGFRIGAVRDRTQLKVRNTFIKRDDRGRFMDVSKNRFKGVRREN
jgi:hypothetical protein